MFTRIVLKRGGKQEGESPFWISFSDLLSALMTLFLVIMAVTLIAVTKNVTAEEQAKIQREKDVRAVMAKIQKASESFKEVKVDESTFRIDLGDVVRFDSGDYAIKSKAAEFLRSYIPVLLNAQASPEGKEWMRRIVVEGFTDQDGTYLYNLGLSLNRSRSVVCVLFAKQNGDETALSDSQKRQIRDLFLVGGYSFNSARKEKTESRRVELKIEFWAIGEERPNNNLIDGKEFGQC
jgi:outer membrane protein OmpA-like peptidoglycan-associated protein